MSKYKLSFLIASLLVIIGLVINILVPTHSTPTLSWPFNFIFLIGIIIAIVNMGFVFKKNKVVNWLSDIPSSVSAISIFSSLVLIMALVPQEKMYSNDIWYSLGFTNIVNSWSFLILSIYLLFILGFVIIKRTNKFNFRNIVFMLNHLGLWIAIASASFGSGDVVKFSMTVSEGETTNVVYNEKSELFEMPFKVELIDFKIDEYYPELILINPHNGAVLNEKKEKHIEIKPNITQSFKDYEIKIIKYIESALPKDSTFIVANVIGSVPVAFIEVKSKEGKTYNGWITNGNKFINPTIVYIDDNTAFAMSTPAPKKFSSLIKLYGENSTSAEKLVEVNKPISVGNWKMYQISYDAELGKWSKSSTFELVKDPWINGVYLGIGMLLIGSLLLFWVGKHKEL